MLVICPGCSIPYELPPDLIGPAGASVCCPVCRLTFVVDPVGELAAVLGRAEGSEPEASAGAHGPAIAQTDAASLASAPTPEASSLASAPRSEASSLASAPTPEASSLASAPRSEASSLAALCAIDDPPGTLAAAAAAGRLFADHGPALLDAFEALERERPGEDVAEEFREALRDVAGVELANAGVEASEDR